MARKRRHIAREPNGRLQRTYARDQGTPEGRARRRMIYGRADTGYPQSTERPERAGNIESTGPSERAKITDITGQTIKAIKT